MQTNEPKVSVIIPTYNRKHYLERAINSVLNQTYTDYELVVVDDASTDGTTSFIAEKYPSVRCVSLPKNCGAGGARNEGIRIARGSFIAFLDSDDEWLPKYLETQIQYIESSPDNVIVFCGCIHQMQDGKIEKFSCQPWLAYPDLTYHLLSENFILTASIVVVSKNALNKAGYFNESLKICQDKELFLRLFCLGNAAHVPYYLVTKYSHSSNLTGDYKLWVKETFDLLDIFFTHELSLPYKHFEIETRSHNAMRLARILWGEKKKFFFAIQMLVKAFIISPTYISQHLWKKLVKAST
ncbi:MULTISPECIES: glycosyltransferase family 2 protein [unclassified Nostoc]|uniref:glycosyltransferase family 2 protein n=1 Tax=unclassified Nostoc TaxID=2593658 RepID=UPI002AD59A9B|nr:glycosyltransferase family 2 protein [Nostoc sp. DedQUE03]MDZ7972836.1 glycosyltransferase family 2 protein [Nostoc sp. DedQUE03]MDZ8045254.1 glycosyltransferase family 2 protein [Nostoc sp. DedQUE02]